MVIQKLFAISGSCLVCFVLGFGCAGTDAASEDTHASGNDEARPAEPNKNIGNTEQNIILPIDGTGGGGSQQCVAACTKLSPTNIAGQCCICNAQAKKFVRSQANANLYLCQ